jgi:hypothetical protein
MESNNQNTNELENIAKKIAESRQQRAAITDWENQGIKKKEIKNGQTIVEKIRPVAKHVLTQLINRINKKEASTSIGTLFKMFNRTKESLRGFGDTADGNQYAPSNYMQSNIIEQSRSQVEFADHSKADIASMIEALNQHSWSNETNISQNNQQQPPLLPPSILMLRREVIKYAVRVELNNIISNQMMPSLSQKGIEKLERKAVSKIEEICQNSNLNQVNEFQSEIEPQNQIINFLTSTTPSTAPSSQDSKVITTNLHKDSQYESAKKPRNPQAKQKKDEQNNRFQQSMNSGMSNVVNINQNQLHQEFLEDRNKSNSSDIMNR